MQAEYIDKKNEVFFIPLNIINTNIDKKFQIYKFK